MVNGRGVNERRTVTVNGSHDDVTNSPARNRLRRVLRLVDIERWWCTGSLDGAETTAASACVSHKLEERKNRSARTMKERNGRAKRTIMVAVASPLSPPQHCPMLGHLASSQTVWSFKPRRSDLILL